MYSYNWDPDTGGILLNSSPLHFSREPRPVFSKELDILGFDRYWRYPCDDERPIMWAEANNYFYRGKLVAQAKGGSFFTPPSLVVIDEPEPNGAMLKLVDVEAMVEKNREILENLTQDTIKHVYNTYQQFIKKVDIFHVSYSGGKDSEVALDIVQRALPHNGFIVVFGDTGMEFPDTYDSVKLAKKKCEESGITFCIAKSHMKPVDSWKMFGPPSSTIRWCCSVHKTTPQLLAIRDYLGKTSFTEMAFVGVRADESVRRSGYDYISYGTKHKGQYSCNPILTWNSAEVYLYIFSNGLHLNEAYKRGNTRAGCLVCPMSTNRNDFLNYHCYKEYTKPLLDIIRDMNSSDKGQQDRIKSYIENNGWKARKNGRDLSISPKDYREIVQGSDLVISFRNHNDIWKQWIKTLGTQLPTDSSSTLKIDDHGRIVTIKVKDLDNGFIQVSTSNESTASNILFLRKFRNVFHKCHYCIGCRVCEANCKYGNIKFNEDGIVSISDNCIKCGQCLELDSGCYVYKSLWLSKGLGNMNKSKSLDCYAAHGPKIEWFQQYVKLGERFMSENSLGNNQVPAFNRFLRDAGIIEGDSETILCQLLKDNFNEEYVWALMLVNLAYTPEVGWYLSTFNINDVFSQSAIVNELSNTEGVSSSAQKSIPAALKRIAALPFSQVGFGIVEKSNKEDGGAKFIRIPWTNVDSRVLLYSLYKFAEACGGYYQFTLSRIMDDSIDSDGVSPSRLFGVDNELMKQILKGLSVNYPEFISVSFTLDLESITLKESKSSKDVLLLF